MNLSKHVVFLFISFFILPHLYFLYYITFLIIFISLSLFLRVSISIFEKQQFSILNRPKGKFITFDDAIPPQEKRFLKILKRIVYENEIRNPNRALR